MYGYLDIVLSKIDTVYTAVAVVPVRVVGIPSVTMVPVVPVPVQLYYRQIYWLLVSTVPWYLYMYVRTRCRPFHRHWNERSTAGLTTKMQKIQQSIGERENMRVAATFVGCC